MKAGRLRDRITLQQPKTTRDRMGGFSTSWQDVATISAELTAITGKEYLAANAERNKTTWRIWIRYLNGVSPAWRVVLHGQPKRLFDIKAVLPDAKRTRIELLCEEGLYRD